MKPSRPSRPFSAAHRFSARWLMAGAIGLVFVASASAQASKDPGKPRRLIDLDAFATRVECDPEKLRLFMKKLDAALEEGRTSMPQTRMETIPC